MQGKQISELKREYTYTCYVGEISQGIHLVVVIHGWGNLLHSIHFILKSEWHSCLIHRSGDHDHIVCGGTQDCGSTEFRLSFWIGQGAKYNNIVCVITVSNVIKSSWGAFEIASVRFKFSLPKLGNMNLLNTCVFKDHPVGVDGFSVWIIGDHLH